MKNNNTTVKMNGAAAISAIMSGKYTFASTTGFTMEDTATFLKHQVLLILGSAFGVWGLIIPLVIALVVIVAVLRLLWKYS